MNTNTPGSFVVLHVAGYYARLMMFKDDLHPFVGKRISVLYYSRHGNKQYTGFLSDIHSKNCRLDMRHEKTCFIKGGGKWLDIRKILFVEVKEV
jgi:hypothetical protein